MFLNYTPLRHKMLKAVAQGRVRVHEDSSWGFLLCYHSTAAQMSRSCNWLWSEALIGVYREHGEVQPSDEGQRILSSWNITYGEPT